MLFTNSASPRIDVEECALLDAAHQLRTPLAAVKLQLNNLHRVSTEPGDASRLDDLSRGIDRAASLTDQLLKLARYDAGDTRPAFTRVDAASLLRDCIADVLPLADHRHQDIGLDADTAAPVFINGIEDDLRILVGNLLDNAVRYTPADGVIDVGLAGGNGTANGKVIIEIKDSGPGIDEDALAHVFDRFYRAGDPDSEGSGLGLSIAARVADLHNAKIDLENRRDQDGNITGLTARLSFAAAN